MGTVGSARGQGREWLVVGDRPRAAVVAGKQIWLSLEAAWVKPWGMAKSVAGEGKETMAGRRGLMIGGKAGQPSAQRSWLPTVGVGVLTGKGSSWSVAGERSSREGRLKMKAEARRGRAGRRKEKGRWEEAHR